MLFAGIILIVVVVIALGSIFVKSDREKAEEAEMEKRLADEVIYDRETGVKMTLEEAENGYIVKGTLTPRFKTDEEIEQHYSDEEKDIEYIKRFFVDYDIVESTEGFEVMDVLTLSEMSKLYEHFEVDELWKYREGVYVALIGIMSRYVSGTFSDTQLAFVVKQDIPAKLHNAFRDYEIEYRDGWAIMKSPGRGMYKDLETLVKALGN